MLNAIFVLTCVVLTIVPLIFVYHGVYKDGVFGRLGLTGIAGSAAFFLLDIADGTTYTMQPLTIIQSASFALFLCWHLWRFHSRVLKAPTKAPCGRLNEIGCPYKVEPK